MRENNFKLNKRRVLLVGIVLLVLLIIAVFVGFIRSRVSSTSPVGMTESYLKKYQKEDKSLTSKITYPFSDKLNSNQEQRYKEIIKKQYRNIKYNISDEYVGDIDANITVEITVVDLKSEYEKANSYVLAHKDNYLNPEGNLDDEKVTNYKLEKLEKAIDKIDYSIVINYYKNDKNQWVMSELSSSDLEKINGTF